MLPTCEESERQIRDAGPVILMAIFVASVVSASSSTALVAIELYREYRMWSVVQGLRTEPFKPIDANP